MPILLNSLEMITSSVFLLTFWHISECPNFQKTIVHKTVENVNVPQILY